MSQDSQGETGVSPPHVPKNEVLPVNSDSEALDSILRALADHRRRCVCHYLARRDDPVPVDDLAELLAASMSEKTRAVLTTEEIEKTRTELVSMHLPKLTEAGIAVHDKEEGVVRLADSPGVRECLDAASNVDLE